MSFNMKFQDSRPLNKDMKWFITNPRWEVGLGRVVTLDCAFSRVNFDVRLD